MPVELLSAHRKPRWARSIGLAVLVVITVQASLLAAGAAGIGDRRAILTRPASVEPDSSTTTEADAPTVVVQPAVPSAATPAPTAMAIKAFRPPLEGRAIYYDPPAPTSPASAVQPAASTGPQLPPALPRPEAPPTVQEQPVLAPQPAAAATVNAPFLSNLPSAEGRSFKFPDQVERWRDLVAPMARQAGLEPALVLAVIQQESGGDPNAVSRAGASGLMQLMPGTFRAYVPDGLIFDPRQNVFAGIYYLRDSLWYHRGDDAWALAGYNSGINGSLQMRADGGVPWDYGGGETIRYIYAVWWNYYRAILAADQG